MSEEVRRSFACFGGTAIVHIRAGERGAAEELADIARRKLLDAHRRLTRFEPDSELCRLNRDPRPIVPASPLLRAVARACGAAGRLSDGLVDATVIDSLERAGYRDSIAAGDGDSSWEAPPRFAPRGAAGPDPEARWRQVGVDDETATISRPPGLRIDGGGLVKGLLADIVGESLAAEPAFSVDCCGDMCIGGSAGRPRRVRIGNPFGGEPLGELAVAVGGVATSGVARRWWTDARGRPAHHLIDPRPGSRRTPASSRRRPWRPRLSSPRSTPRRRCCRARAAPAAGSHRGERWSSTMAAP